VSTPPPPPPQVRPNIQTTMVVPVDEFRKYGGKRGGEAYTLHYHHQLTLIGCNVGRIATLSTP
jgi:hypothetical protein